ncbi:MAG: CCA tRNA nucleotidyltransferase, partial [Candidatus Latescibacterota bacterium]
MYDKAFTFISKLKSLTSNSTAYIVGGAVRDYIMGRDCADIDIVTDVPMCLIEEHFDTHDIGSNKDFGIVVVEF